MRAINHALTGAVIGLSIENPAIALPVAFLSHYVLDVIPHQGSAIKSDDNLRSKSFLLMLYLDAVLCTALVLFLFVTKPTLWLQASIAAFLAAAPDLLSFGRFWAAKRHKPYAPKIYSRFASRIQWFERPIGAYIEIAWFITMCYVLYALLG